jgi:hypothetical protein
MSQSIKRAFEMRAGLWAQCDMSDRWPVPRMQPNNAPASSGTIPRRSVNNLNNIIVQRYDSVAVAILLTRRQIPVQIGIVQSSLLFLLW